MISPKRRKPVPLLLVEDDAEDVEIARRAFEQTGIANPLYVVRDADETMEFLRQTGRYADPDTAPGPGLILLDLNLPGVGGLTLLKMIKGDPGLRRIPVVVLTTSTDETDVIACYDIGANSYVAKPVEFDKFVEVVAIMRDYWLGVAAIPEDWSHLEI